MIRPLSTDDLDACVEIYVEAFAAPPWEESWAPVDARLRLTDFLATPRSLGVCALDDGAVTGFALGHRERSGSKDHFLLQEMCVAPGRQRAGVGAALLEALGAAMPDVRHWFLLTARDSHAADFYARQGFRPAGRLGVFVRP